MSARILYANRDAFVLPAGIKEDSKAAHRMSALIRTHLQNHPAKAVIKLEGEESDCVYLMVSGWLCVSKFTMEGNRLIVDILLSGNILDPASADVDISAVEVETLSDVTYAAIPRGTWLRFVDDNPDIVGALHQETGAAWARMSERMLRLGKGGAETIIAYALCELCLRSTGQGLPEVKEFHIPMNQQQLGDLCGLSSVHICRTLRRFERNGILDVSDHMDITIRDIDRLADLAEIDPDDLRNEIVPNDALPPLRNCS